MFLEKVYGYFVVVALALAFFHAAPALAEHPSNGWIVWASDREQDRHEIYMMKADGTGVTRLTTTGARMPMWSPDGRWIAYETVPLGQTRVMRWDKSEDMKIFNGKPMFWLWDGTRVVCMDSSDDLYKVDPETGDSTFWLHKSDFSRIASKRWKPTGLTADGRWLVTWTDRYRNGYSGTNGTFTAYHAAVLLDLNNKGNVYFFGRGCEPTTPPGGEWVYHVCGGTYCDTHPDVYHMKISDRQSRTSYSPVVAHADGNWGHEYFPRISTDGNWLMYGATTGCHDHDTCDYEVFIHPLSGDNDNRERLTNDPHNDQWPHLYVGELWSSGPPELTSIEVIAAKPTISDSGSTEIIAYSKDQNGNPIDSDMAWSVSGGGFMNPTSDSQRSNEHTSTFSSDGSSGSFVITASSAGIEGHATVEVVSFVLPLKINCGSNEHDVDGWLRDDAFVTGGQDWINPDTVDITGVDNAAPAEVYKSVRHKSPHVYNFDIPNGSYLLRIHFTDKYTDRHMNYYAEGVQILDDFDISSEAGGTNKALVKDFLVEVEDGDGLQLEAQSDGDVFEAGIEILPWQQEEPWPDEEIVYSEPQDYPDEETVYSEPQDYPPDADGGIEDGSDQAAEDSVDPRCEEEPEELVSGSCAACSSASDGNIWGFLVLLLSFVLMKRKIF